MTESLELLQSMLQIDHKMTTIAYLDRKKKKFYHLVCFVEDSSFQDYTTWYHF